MMDKGVIALGVFLFAALSAGGLAAALVYPRLSESRVLDDRLARISRSSRGRRRDAVADENKGRKRTVEKSLRELDERQKAAAKKGKVTLVGRMRQGGLAWSRNTYYAVCAVVSILVMLALWTVGVPPLQAVGFALATGLALPHIFVSLRCKRRMSGFSSEFANSIDIVVRGLKSGLPLSDGLKVIAQESKEPVAGEFNQVVQDLTLGLPMELAVNRLAERVPLSETAFFAVVLSSQSKTGGSLSEALGNLSAVLRDRKNMAGKIKAMSSEAKASATIIGLLPICVAGFVYLTSPDYISVMFTNVYGNIVLGLCLVWMSIGILVMRKMINFDY